MYKNPFIYNTYMIRHNQFILVAPPLQIDPQNPITEVLFGTNFTSIQSEFNTVHEYS